MAMKGSCRLSMSDGIPGLYRIALPCVVTLPVSPSWAGLCEAMGRSKLILSAPQTPFMSLCHEAVGQWPSSILSLLFHLETYWKQLSSKIFHPNTCCLLYLLHYFHYIINKQIHTKYVYIYIYLYIHKMLKLTQYVCYPSKLFPLHCLIIFHISHVFTSYKPDGDEKSIFGLL